MAVGRDQWFSCNRLAMDLEVTGSRRNVNK